MWIVALSPYSLALGHNSENKLAKPVTKNSHLLFFKGEFIVTEHNIQNVVWMESQQVAKEQAFPLEVVTPWIIVKR